MSITGITPAWAGKRTGKDFRHETTEDYPRVGGEEQIGQLFGFSDKGLPPRGRGRVS